MEELSAFQEYGVLGAVLSMVLIALYAMVVYIKKIESRTNIQHIKREKELIIQLEKQRSDFEAFTTERENKLIAVITNSNDAHVKNTEIINNTLSNMSKSFAEINEKNNKQHLELSETMRNLVLDHMKSSQDLFVRVVSKNTEALSDFNSSNKRS